MAKVETGEACAAPNHCEMHTELAPNGRPTTLHTHEETDRLISTPEITQLQRNAHAHTWRALPCGLDTMWKLAVVVCSHPDSSHTVAASGRDLKRIYFKRAHASWVGLSH